MAWLLNCKLKFNNKQVQSFWSKLSLILLVTSWKILESKFCRRWWCWMWLSKSLSIEDLASTTTGSATRTSIKNLDTVTTFRTQTPLDIRPQQLEIMACLHKAQPRFTKRQIIMKTILVQTATTATQGTRLISKMPKQPLIRMQGPTLTIKVKSNMETTSAVSISLTSNNKNSILIIPRIMNISDRKGERQPGKI